MPSYKTVGYFTNWVCPSLSWDLNGAATNDVMLGKKQGIYARSFQPQSIPASHLTHILCKSSVDP